MGARIGGGAQSQFTCVIFPARSAEEGSFQILLLGFYCTGSPYLDLSRPT